MRTWFRVSLQVDSVLSADGWRPVRRGQYSAILNAHEIKHHKRILGPARENAGFGTTPARRNTVNEPPICADKVFVSR